TLGSVVQSWPQAPQLLGSDARSTHLLVQRSGAGATQLEEQVGAPVLVEQSAVGAEHTCPQAPQLAGSVVFVSQPSSARVEQCATPETQALAGTLQVPFMHVIPVAPVLMFASIVQSCPHVPQLAGSELRSTHFDPHRLGSGVT